MATVFRPPLYSPKWAPDPYGVSRRSQDGVQASLLLNTLQRGSVIYFTGFETGDSSELTQLGAGASVQTAVVRSGNYALKQALTSSSLIFGLSITQAVCRFYLQVPALTGSVIAIWRERVGATLRLTLRFNASNNLEVFDAGATLGLSTTAGTKSFNINQWYRIEIGYDLVANGVVQVSVDGTVDINTTHTNDVSGTPTTLFAISGNTTPNEYFFDDILIANGLIPYGPGQVIARQGTTGTPTYDAWTKNGAATAALCWSDTPFNASTNCTDALLSDAQTMLVSTFSSTQSGHGPQVVGLSDGINAAKTSLIAKESSAGTMSIRRRINGTDTDTAITTTTADKYFDDGIWTTTPANLDLLEAGAVSGSGSLTTTVEDVWVMVDFATSLPVLSGGPPFFQSDWPNPRGPIYSVELRNFDPQSTQNILIGSRTRPFYQSDWPLPNRGPRFPERERSFDQQNQRAVLLPGSRLTPFNQSDWPLTPRADPRSIAAKSQDGVRVNLLVPPILQNSRLVPFYQSDWPLPQTPSYRLRDWAQPPDTLLTLLPGQLTPFNQDDWPLPGRPYYQLRDWQQPQQPIFTTLQKPFKQTDWPNPRGYEYRLRIEPAQEVNPKFTTLPGSRLTPFNQSDWPNPRTSSTYRLWDWAQPPNNLILIPVGPVAPPFFQTDWPNPRGPYYQLRDLQRPPNNLLFGIPIPIGFNPFYQTDWPLPQTPPYRLRDWQQPPNLPITTLPGSRTTPFAETDWPLPNRGPQRMPSYTWLQSKPFYYKDAPPFAGERHSFQPLPRDATHFRTIDKINRIIAGDVEQPSPYRVQVPVNDFSLNFPPDVKVLILDPAGPLATGLIVLPVDAVDRDRLWITSTQTITAFTLQAASGQTVRNAPTSLSGGTSISFIYNAPNLVWYRLE